MKNNLKCDFDCKDYYPFGMITVGRSWEVGNQYRYGFNTQELDDEVYGTRILNNAKFWEYDTRLGRRWNMDPIRKEFESPYCSFSNSPIYIIDPLGSDTIIFHTETIATDSKSSGLDNYPSSDAVSQVYDIQIKAAAGPDVFYNTTNFTHFDSEGNVVGSFSTKTRFDPVANTVSGVTTTKGIFGFGTIKDRSQVTLGKLAPPELLDYLIDKSAYNSKEYLAYKSAKYYSSDYTLYGGLKTVTEFALSCAGFSLGVRAFSSIEASYIANNYFKGAAYSEKVVLQIKNAKDIYHAFPSYMDEVATKFGTGMVKQGGDKQIYYWLELEGTLNGQKGVFQYIKGADGVINHRCFVAY